MQIYRGLRAINQSEEVVLSNDCGEVVLWLALYRGGHALELLESHRVVDAFLEKIELGLAHTKQTVHLEETLTSVVEGVEANWFEG